MGAYLRWFVVLVVVSTLATCPGIAMATDAAERGVRAEALFQQGRQSMKSGEYRDACRLFAQSQELDPSIGTLLNLALCEEQIGEIAAAWLHLRDCLARLPESDKRRPIAAQHFAAVEPRVALLTIVAPNDGQRPKEVLLDGTPLSDPGSADAIPLNAGPHEIRLVWETGQERYDRLDLREGDRARWGFPAAPSATQQQGPESTPAPTQRASARMSWDAASADLAAERGASGRNAISYVLLGIGGASLIATGVLSLFVLDRKATVSAHCHDGLCDDAGYQASIEGPVFATAGTLTFASGAAAIAAGGYLFFAKPPNAQRRISGWASTTLMLRTIPRPQGAEVEIGGAF